MASVSSVAIKCNNLEAMVDFYGGAFSAGFKEVDVGVEGMRCFFGRGAGIVFKLVSGREAADFESYPIHQLGFDVLDVESLVRLAEKHGGKREGDVIRDGEVLRGCVRDPDGNTLELTQPAPDSDDSR
jgi:predicted enzyme related to lactoylglutathione lyase